MYNELINSEVLVVVSTRADMIFEYTGVLCEETEKTIKLKNVEINHVMLNFQKSVFGSGFSAYKKNIDEVILNKDYVISCSNNQ